MKKFVVGLTSVATIALMSGPVALAWHMPSNDIEVENDNHAYVSNTVTVSANSGSNEIVAVKGGSVSGDITTGDAYADSIVNNMVNSNDTKIKAHCRRGCSGDIEVENDNGVMVRNAVVISASSGSNEIVAVKGGTNAGGDIRTGDATTFSDVVNIVNTNVTRIRR